MKLRLLVIALALVSLQTQAFADENVDQTLKVLAETGLLNSEVNVDVYYETFGTTEYGDGFGGSESVINYSDKQIAKDTYKFRITELLEGEMKALQELPRNSLSPRFIPDLRLNGKLFVASYSPKREKTGKNDAQEEQIYLFEERPVGEFKGVLITVYREPNGKASHVQFKINNSQHWSHESKLIKVSQLTAPKTCRSIFGGTK